VLAEYDKSIGDVPINVEAGEQVLRALSLYARGFNFVKKSNAITNNTLTSSIALMPGLEASGKIWTAHSSLLSDGRHWSDE